MKRFFTRRAGFVFGFLAFVAVGAVAGNVGPMMIQNYGADIDNLPLFRGNLGLAPSATVDTTNASNITSGTLPAAQLPSTVSQPAVTRITGSGIWIKPIGITWVRVWAYPGGTGGPMGFLCPVSGLCTGSSGPGGGSVGYWEGPASSLGAAIPVTVGAGGLGGWSGLPLGAQGGVSSFGSLAQGYPGGLGAIGIVDLTGASLVPPGYGAGIADQNAQTYQTSGVAGAEYIANAPGMYLGAPGAVGRTAPDKMGASSAMCGGPGGGAGAWADTSGVSDQWGTMGGSNMEFTVVINTGALFNIPPANGPDATGRCMGGGGQGGLVLFIGMAPDLGVGGHGGFPGGAGGAGGDGTVGQTSPGNGGYGADGEILVETW